MEIKKYQHRQAIKHPEFAKLQWIEGVQRQKTQCQQQYTHSNDQIVSRNIDPPHFA
jgi:hypothetical protein